MPWMIPATKLDPDQRRLLTSNIEGNQWISGLPGTGKSVLLLHMLFQELKANPKLNVCIVLFTHSLIKQFKSALEEFWALEVITYHQFRKRSTNLYDIILVDEVQDLPYDVLAQALTQCTKLYVAGDQGQSIYEDVITSEQTRKVIGKPADELTTIHRLTGKLIDVVKVLFPEKQVERAQGSRLQKIDIVCAMANKFEDEVEYIWDGARNTASPNEPSAILIPSHAGIATFIDEVLRSNGKPRWEIRKNQYGKPDYDALNNMMAEYSIPLMYIGSSYGNLETVRLTTKVAIMTYHSAKGLDFKSVFLPGLSSDVSIWSGDPGLERTLLFVAMTRTRLNLTISYTGSPHHLIAQLGQDLVTKIKLPILNRPTSTAANTLDIFF